MPPGSDIHHSGHLLEGRSWLLSLVQLYFTMEFIYFSSSRNAQLATIGTLVWKASI